MCNISAHYLQSELDIKIGVGVKSKDNNVKCKNQFCM